jgi:hypothetical protein
LGSQQHPEQLLQLRSHLSRSYLAKKTLHPDLLLLLLLLHPELPLSWLSAPSVAPECPVELAWATESY